MKGAVESSFRLNLTIMRFVGCYPLEKYPRLYKFYSCFIFTIALVPASLLGVIQLIHGERRNGMFDVISISVVFMTPKLFSVVINGDRIQKCVVRFDDEIFVSQSQDHMDIVDICVGICHRNSYVFCSGAAIAVVSWCGKLFFSDANQMPLDVWVPFAGMPVLYNCLYFDLIIAVVYSGVSCAAVDPLIAGLICHASGHVQIIKEILRHLDKDLGSRLIYEKIAKCIEHYSAISSLVEEFEGSFSSAIMCQFVHSVFTLCICCLQISKLQDFDITFLILANNLIVVLIQVYFYCYYGTILIEENETLRDFIYMSNWYEYNLQSKKALMILMERSKRPLAVTAGKIVDLSLQTFTVILRRSYSLLAVLKNY